MFGSGGRKGRVQGASSRGGARPRRAGWRVWVPLGAACAALIAAAGCASAPAAPQVVQDATQAVPPLRKGLSRVVFIRTDADGTMRSSVMCVSKGKAEMVGFSVPGGRLIGDVPPGPHRFMMVAGDRVTFLDAKLEPGKTYYARLGSTKEGGTLQVELAPLSASLLESDPYRTLASESPWTLNTNYARSWAKSNEDSLEAIIQARMPAWEALPDRPVLGDAEGS